MPIDETDSPAFTPSRPSTGLSRPAIVLVVVAFVLGIAVTALFVSQYRQWVPKSAQSMFDPAPASVDEAAASPGTGFQPPPEAGAAARALNSDVLNARQAAIAAQLATLEARAAVIDRDSQAAANNAVRAEALLIAFSARRAIDRGLALGSIEPQLRQRFELGQPRAVNAIIAASRAPVTLEDLRVALEARGPDLATGVSTDGWWTSLRRELSSLVVIRHEGTPSPRAADRLARVRRLLDAGQVEAAVTEFARLPGAPKAAAWMSAARRYVQAHAALDTIETAAILGRGLEAAVVASRTAPIVPPPPVATEPPIETTATATIQR